MIQVPEVEKQEMLAKLKAGNQKSFVAFEFPFGVLNKPTIVVSDISDIIGERVMCHFLMGVKSESYDFEKKDIIAIGDMENGDVEILGWSGKFIVLRPEVLEKCSDRDKYDLKEN